MKNTSVLSKKDKFIRLSASVAISGLTLSFLLSEALEAKLRDPAPIFQEASGKKISLSVLNPVFAFGDLLEEIPFNNMQLMLAKLEPQPEQSIFKQMRTRTEKVATLVVQDQIKLRASTANKSGTAINVVNVTQKIKGKIVGADQGVEGYFEVGLYNKVDSLGEPLGYPVVQQILPWRGREFSLDRLRGLERAYLFARFVSTGKNKKNDNNIKEGFFAYPKNPLIFHKTIADASFDIPVSENKSIDDKTVSVSSAVKRDEKIIHGRIGAMFGKRGSFIPVDGALIKLRGTNIEAKSGINGDFSLDLTGINGELLLEIIKPGYLPRIQKINATEVSKSLYLEIASRSAIDQMAYFLGIRQGNKKSVILGYAKNNKSEGLQGITAQTTLKSDGPYYFNEEGYPSTNTSVANKGTSTDGRFIFFNVDSGTGILELSNGGENIAPIRVAAVDAGELIVKELEPIEKRIRGRIFNPINNAPDNSKPHAIAGARVRIEGSPEWTTTDAFGAFELPNLRYIKNEDLQVEFSADKFYNHHFQINAEKTYVNLFAFPSVYISGLAASVGVQLDPLTAIILGSVGAGKKLRMDAMSDHGAKNLAKDYYFSENQVIRGSYGQTDGRFGTYIIFNVPRGRTLLHGLDNAAKVKNSNVLYTNASTVTVVVD